MKSILKLIKRYNVSPEKFDFYVIEGKRIVKQAIEYNVKIEHILISESYSLKNSEFLKDIKNNYNIITVSVSEFKAISSTKSPQGICAIIKRKNFSLFDIISTNKSIFILDNIREPGNLGTIIRTCVAFDFGGVILTKGCVYQYNPKIIRSSMGAILNIPIIKIDNVKSIILELKKNNYYIVVSDVNAKTKLHNLKVNKKIAYIIGNEAHGIDKKLLTYSDNKVIIPIVNIESLNVAITASILAYNHYIKQNYP